MTRFVAIVLLVLGFAFSFASLVYAIDDPLTFKNNKYGVHIFDIEEIDKVAPLVNSNGGEWGYVTVPLREDQRDREKWQLFMHKTREMKLIPIVRLATTMQPNGWSKPGKYTAIDFANFLNDLDWPTKNRYVIVYNEPNHANEWAGTVNPEEYADELSHTISVFKDRNDDFYMLGAGMDAAAPNAGTEHMKWDRFMQRMFAHNPNAFYKLDGWNSHSYPNPGFSGSPFDRHDHSVVSYMYEVQLAEQYAGRNLPIFITETGWSDELLNDETIANYLKTAYLTVWENSEIVAITPFVLHAGAGPFAPFSLLDEGGNPKPQYTAIQSMSKVKGEPTLNNGDDNWPMVAGEEVNRVAPYVEEKKPFEFGKWDSLFEWADWFGK